MDHRRTSWILLVGMLGLWGCGRGSVVDEPGKRADEATGAGGLIAKEERPREGIEPPTPGPIRFTDVAAESGIDFRHVSGMTETKYVPTANGSGVAIFDADGDGRMDVYLANGSFLPVGSKATGPNRLYLNRGGWKFEDATDASGLGFSGYCHGVAVGDIDNDGDADVFLANYGPSRLFRNEGGGRFLDATEAAGLGVDAWSSGAAFFDLEGDGDLDLYVSRYGDWILPRDDLWCGDKEKNVRLYCDPKEIRTARHALYRNEGEGRFVDVTEAAGVARDDGHGFGVVAVDVDDDGRTDLYVANDQDPNFLFLNRGGGRFEDATLTSGAAFDRHGQAQSGMGAETEDVDGDGRPELFVTNFEGEYNTLYRNLGAGLFVDVTAQAGLGVDSLPYIGWGCALADFDSDGWPDVVVANAHIDDNRSELGQDSPYEEPPLLYRNQGNGQFRPVGAGAGDYFTSRHLGHGLAAGDLDDDGDLDLVINHKDGLAGVLRNESPREGNRWVRLVLRGTRSNRDGVGARVIVEVAGRQIHRQRKGGGSFLSSHDPRLLIGVGQAEQIDRVIVKWPSGAESRLENLELERTYPIEEPNP